MQLVELRRQQIPRYACMVFLSALTTDTVRAPGWRNVATYPPSLMDGRPENFPTPPLTSMRNLAADGYGPRTADLDTSLRWWDSTPAMRI
jgi:hypothetical protein